MGEDKETHTFTGGTNSFTIDNVPIGTTCTAYEVTANTDYLTSDHQGSGHTVSISASPVAEYNGNANSISTATITNTYRSGKLQLKKTVQGSANSPGTYYFFRVELTEPAGVEFNLPTDSNHNPTDANPYGINGLTSAGSVSYDSGNKKYTVIMNIRADGTVEEITDLPWGTAYTVTEVYRQGGTGPYVDISNDPNHPHVSSNNGTGRTINSASVLFNIENLYRKITLTKKDAKPNSSNADIKLNGATYYLLRLENSEHFSGGTPDPTMTAAFASATALTDVSVYYSASSGPYVTGNGSWSTGEIVVDDSSKMLQRSFILRYGIVVEHLCCE